MSRFKIINKETEELFLEGYHPELTEAVNAWFVEGPFESRENPDRVQHLFAEMIRKGEKVIVPSQKSMKELRGEGAKLAPTTTVRLVTGERITFIFSSLDRFRKFGMDALKKQYPVLVPLGSCLSCILKAPGIDGLEIDPEPERNVSFLSKYWIELVLREAYSRDSVTDA